MNAHAKNRRDALSAEVRYDVWDGCFFHAATIAKLSRNGQAKKRSIFTQVYGAHKCSMDNTTRPRPYAEIADRLKWHRDLMGMTQQEYADQLNVKRARYSRWEGGIDRLSLDGALVLRAKYGLSLDFLFEGIDDALPMTLRNAWIGRPSSRS